MIKHPLKLAVGIHGTILFLENYPYEEEVKEQIEETEEQELWDLEEECFWYERD